MVLNQRGRRLHSTDAYDPECSQVFVCVRGVQAFVDLLLSLWYPLVVHDVCKCVISVFKLLNVEFLYCLAAGLPGMKKQKCRAFTCTIWWRGFVQTDRQSMQHLDCTALPTSAVPRPSVIPGWPLVNRFCSFSGGWRREGVTRLMNQCYFQGGWEREIAPSLACTINRRDIYFIPN